MPYPQFTLLRRYFVSAALAGSLALTVGAQVPDKNARTVPSNTSQTSSLRAEAYYHFSLGHLYEELAAAYGNRSEYVNKAIENYRLAIKEDPNASFLVEDIAELYRISGRIREAVEEAENALKTNPNDLNARRVLAHIYTQEIGEPQSNHIDEGIARRAIDQYKQITDKDPKDIESLIMLGRLDRLVNNSVDAEAAFRQALQVDPDNEDAVTGLASIYGDRNDPKHAAELLQKLTAKTPTPRAYVSLASYYEQMRDYGKAADAYSRALDLDPSRVELKAAMATDEAEAGRFDDALKTFQELADASPQETMPLLSMAQIYRSQRNFDQAQQALDRAKAIDANNLDVRLEQARLLDAEGKTVDAITVLRGVIDDMGKRESGVQPSARAELLDSLGALYRTDQQFDRAVDTFRQAAALNGSAENREDAQIVETYRAKKDYAKALAETDAAIKKFPNDRTLQQIRAEVLSDQGKFDEAVAVLKHELGGKDDRDIYLALADTYQKAKNYGEMENALDNADKLSTTPDDRATIDFMRGAMYERQKAYDKAEKQFRAALQIDPKNASALNYLGYMFADQGIRLEEAKDLIKRAVTIEPNNYAYLDSLGWVYYRLNRLQDAEQQLRRSVEMMSSDPTIHDHLGDVYFKEGRLKEAIEQWQSSLNAWNTSAPSDLEPEEVAKVQRKLDDARVRLARERTPGSHANP